MNGETLEMRRRVVTLERAGGRAFDVPTQGAVYDGPWKVVRDPANPAQVLVGNGSTDHRDVITCGVARFEYRAQTAVAIASSGWLLMTGQERNSHHVPAIGVFYLDVSFSLTGDVTPPLSGGVAATSVDRSTGYGRYIGRHYALLAYITYSGGQVTGILQLQRSAIQWEPTPGQLSYGDGTGNLAWFYHDDAAPGTMAVLIVAVPAPTAYTSVWVCRLGAAWSLLVQSATPGGYDEVRWVGSIQVDGAGKLVQLVELPYLRWL